MVFPNPLNSAVFCMLACKCWYNTGMYEPGRLDAVEEMLAEQLAKKQGSEPEFEEGFEFDSSFEELEDEQELLEMEGLERAFQGESFGNESYADPFDEDQENSEAALEEHLRSLDPDEFLNEPKSNPLFGPRLGPSASPQKQAFLEQGGTISLEDGSEIWRNQKGEIHREDGPAVSGPAGEYWLQNGIAHREDGPAVVTQYEENWFYQGKLHREGGPAKTHADGSEEWYALGRKHRFDGPAVLNLDGSLEWWVDGELHRESMPAKTWPDGSSEWWFRDKRHRADGPAVIIVETNKFLHGPSVHEEWWLAGHQYSHEQWASIVEDLY